MSSSLKDNLNSSKDSQNTLLYQKFSTKTCMNKYGKDWIKESV